MSQTKSSNSKRKKVPHVADLIDDAVIMISKAMSGEPIALKPSELSIYLNMLVTVDKNNREAKAAFGKLAPIMTDEQLDESIKAHLESIREPE